MSTANSLLIRIGSQMRVQYNVLTKTLSLTAVETDSSRTIEIQFDSHLTHDLTEGLKGLAGQNHGKLGVRPTTPPTPR